MKKQNLAYLMTLTVLATHFPIPAFSQVYGEEENALYEAYDQETDTAENSVEDFGFVPEEEMGVENDAFITEDAEYSDTSDSILFAANEDDLKPAGEEKLNGLIEDVEQAEILLESNANPDTILFAADTRATQLENELKEYPIETGSAAYFLLTPQTSGIYHFVGSSVSNISILDSNGGSVLAGFFEDISLLSAQLTAGTLYEITVQPDAVSSSLYYYQLPRFCVEVLKKDSASGQEMSDYEEKITYEKSSLEVESFLSDITYPVQHGSYYFLIVVGRNSSADGLDWDTPPAENGDGTYSVDLRDPLTNQSLNHTWKGGVVDSTATCTEEGVCTYQCVCGKNHKTESIPKVAHSWTAYNANGDRTCSVCGTTEHNASMAVPATPSYEIAGKPTKVKVKADGSRKLTVSWKKPVKSKLKKIAGYYIEVATDKNFTNIVRTRRVKKTKTSFTFKRLNKKQKYYVRVRFYMGSQISMWSAVKGRKVK